MVYIKTIFESEQIHDSFHGEVALMEKTELFENVSNNEIKKEDLAEEIIQNPDLIPSLIKGLDESKPGIKYGCSKILYLISERNPGILYPQMDFFISQLDSEITFHRWDAILQI